MLTKSGYEVAQKGDNGFVCMVMRGFMAPTYTPSQFRNLVYDPALRAPMCFALQAAREVLPFYELRTKLAMQGKNPDEIAEGVQAAYARGELPQRTGVSFAYMCSADQNLASGVRSLASWRLRRSRASSGLSDSAESKPSDANSR